MKIIFYIIGLMLVFSEIGYCMRTKSFMRPFKQRKLVVRKQQLLKITPKNTKAAPQNPTFRVPIRNQPNFFKKPALFRKRPDLFRAPNSLFQTPELFKKPDNLFETPDNLFETPDKLFKTPDFFRI